MEKTILDKNTGTKEYLVKVTSIYGDEGNEKTIVKSVDSTELKEIIFLMHMTSWGNDTEYFIENLNEFAKDCVTLVDITIEQCSDIKQDIFGEYFAVDSETDNEVTNLEMEIWDKDLNRIGISLSENEMIRVAEKLFSNI